MNDSLTTRRSSDRRPPAGPRRAAPARTPLPTAYSLQPAAHPAPSRRGISLLEVLISMFVLLFGLMGVAAIFPLGNHYAGRGEQLDRGSALAQAGFAELKARGMLKPELWLYADPEPPLTTDFIIRTPSNTPKKTVGYFNSPFFSALFPSPLNPQDQDYRSGPGFAFVIDPLGAAAAIQEGVTDFDVFPIADLSPTKLIPTDPTAAANMPWRWPVRRMTLPVPGTLDSPSLMRMRSPVAETMFRLHDDVTNELPKEGDRPGIQRWTVDAAGYPQDQPWQHTLLSRQFAGNYSWIATIVPSSRESLFALQPANPRFGSDLYEVSVAVFNKRDLVPSAESERAFQAAFNVGGELVLYSTNDLAGSDAIDAATKDIRAGEWIAVAGFHPTTGKFLLKWYRLLSFDNETSLNQTISPSVTGSFAARRATLDGPEWPMPGNTTVQDLRAILLPGVIGVATQMLPMEAAQ